jgi:hypothetical protein
LWPPFHFNCRTTVRAIYDQAEIDGAGGPDKFYSQGMPDFKPAEGFGRYPVDKCDSWWDLTDSMRERAGEYGLEVEFMEAREKLVGIEPTPDNPAERAAVNEAEAYALENLGVEYADYTGIDSSVANEWNANLKRTMQEFTGLTDMLRFTGSAEAQNELVRTAYQAINIARVREAMPHLPDDFTNSVAASLTRNDMAEFKISDRTIARSVLLRDKNMRQFSGIGISNRYGQDMQVLLSRLESDVASGFHPLGTATVKAAHDHDVGHMLDNLLNLRNDPDMLAIWHKYTTDEINKELSGYGAMSIRDFIAEGWAEYCNNPNRRPLSIRIGGLILYRYALWKSRNI